MANGKLRACARLERYLCECSRVCVCVNTDKARFWISVRPAGGPQPKVANDSLGCIFCPTNTLSHCATASATKRIQIDACF